MASIETMTPRERVMNALAGKPVDRTPVANPTNLATVELMDLVDAPFPAACRDPELNARLAATGHTELGFDSISPYFTIIQESSALGCEMQWEQKDNWPTVRMTNPIWQGPDDVAIPPGFLEHPDCLAITRSITLLKQEFGDNFWPEIMANEPIFTSAQGALQAVLTGTEPVAGMMGSYYVANQKETGAPITALFPVDGVPVADSSMGILVDAPHPNAARLFVHWILSPEGQEAIVPILKDYPALPTAKGPVIPGYPESLAELPKVLNVTDVADFANLWNTLCR